MSDSSGGFRFRGLMGDATDGKPWTMKLVIKDTETLSKGDMVNIETGVIDLAATGDTDIIGMVLETKAGTTAVTEFEVIVDPRAIYGVYDPNARVLGATLDIAGATGVQTVVSSSGKEFVVIAPSTAAQETLVIINRDIHPFTKTS